MWFVSFGLLAAFVCWYGLKGEVRYALGASVVLSLLVPSWVTVPVGRFPLDATVAISAFSLLVYLLHRKGDIWPRRINVVDLTFLAFLICNLVSDWLVGGITSGALPRSAGEWIAPYLIGRLAITGWGDVRRLTPVVVTVCVTLCSLALVESFGRVNLFESLYGIRTGDEMPREIIRWGIKRAFGPVKNPIYFGVLLLLLAPWIVYAASQAAQQKGPRWWFFTPLLVVVGIFCTVSRGPILGIATSAYFAAIVLGGRWRHTLLAIGGVGLLVLIANYQATIKTLDWLSNRSAERHSEVLVNEDVETLTPTTARLLLVKVYGPAMRRAGLFGFGTERTSTFPPNVPMGPQDPETMRRIWTVDNTYVLFVLRFGYLGITSFVLLGLVAIACYARLGSRQGGRGRVFAAAMAGAIGSTMLVLATVWMPQDFGYYLIWSYGIAAGLHGNQEVAV